MAKACDALGAAKWAMIRTPAKNRRDIRTRAYVLQAMFSAVEDMGTPVDNRHLVMLSVLINDILGEASNER